MPCGTVNGKPLTDKENQESQQQETTPASQNPVRDRVREVEQQHEVQQRAEALALKLAQTYEELTRLLERNPGMKRQMTEGEAREDKVYQKLKQRLKIADMAPRCQWVRQDGTSCGSPQMKQHIYCFAHMQMAEARALMLRLPPPEDANAIQIGIMRIQKAMLEGTISTKMAGLLLYSMQLALTNVGRTTFGQAKDEEMVRETVDEEEAISRQQSAFSQDQTFETQRNGGSGGGEDLPRINADERGLQGAAADQDQHQRPFTAEGAEDAKEEKGLPRMDADERGLKGAESSRVSEFVPMPGGYGFERVRLRMEPELGAERRPVQATSGPVGQSSAGPHENAQPHANLG